MILHRLGLINKNQRGFTLIELVIAIAITGIITGGITMTIFQVITGNIRTSNHMTAVRQVQSAGYWVSHDTQMAQLVESGASSGFPLTLTWTEWGSENVTHQVTYTLEDNKLWRGHVISDNSTVDNQTGIMAQYIDPATSCNFTDTDGDGIDDTLVLTVTATVGSGSPQEQSETRVYEVIPRPSTQ